jgi:hypothetical protein
MSKTVLLDPIERWLFATSKKTRCFNAEIPEGIVPSSIFELSEMCCSAAMSPIVEGILPVKEFPPRVNTDSEFKLPIADGMHPSKLLSCRCSAVKCTKSPIAAGIVPVRLLAFSEIEEIPKRQLIILSGIFPRIRFELISKSVRLRKFPIE